MASGGQMQGGSQCVPSALRGYIHACTYIEKTDNKTGHPSQSHSIGPMSLHTSQWVESHTLADNSYSAETLIKVITLARF